MNHIQASTFKFLRTLEKNNNRTWFQENKPKFLVEKEFIKSFLEQLKNRIEEEDQLEKMHLFRIYRDVRFSKDKTPYKTHFGGSFSRATKHRRGGYYFHIAPGDCFVGGGFYSPDKNDLYRIRKEIEIDDKPLRKIFSEPAFVENFGLIQGNELKTSPRGFPKDHHAIDLLRKKQFYVLRRFSDEEMMKDDILEKAVSSYRALRPYFDYMSEVLTTNLNGESIL